METRTTWSKVNFPQAFALPGSDMMLPAGHYDLLIEEERLQGLTFDAYRKTAAFIRICRDPRFPGRTELQPVSDSDLQQAQGHAAMGTATPVLIAPPGPDQRKGSS